MNAKRYLLLLFLLCVAVTSLAPAPKRGKERLLELVVAPKVDLSFKFDFSSSQTFSDLTNEASLSDQVARLRGEVKQSPDDARLLIQFGELLHRNADTNAAKECFQKAAASAEKHLNNRPLDGLSQIDLGDAYWELNKVEAAEHAYRKATQVSSNEWRCWVALGEFLDSQVAEVLLPTNSDATATSTSVKSAQPSSEEMERVMKWRAEAAPCFDRAVALAPQDVEVYLRRAWHKHKEADVNRLIQHYRTGEKLDNIGRSTYSKDSIPDLKKAAALQPQAYQLIALTAYFEWLSGAIGMTATESDRPPEFPDFSATSRRSIADAMERLREIGNSSDPKRAAGALELLAGLQMLTQIRMGFTNDLMIRDMKRAVSLDPTREGAWDLLLGGLLETASPEELAQACESRLKQKKSARNYLLLAKSLYRCGSYGKAVEAAEAGLKLEAKNIALNLMLAATLMRQDKEWAQVESVLERVGEFTAEIKDSEEKAQRASELGLNMAIGMAIKGSPEEAKALLNAIARKFPEEEERAKEIFDAVP